MKYLIIIPTYCEAENINKIIDAVFSNTDKLDVNILVIDDGSKDGTPDIVKNLMNGKYKNKLFMIERSGKMGLASAYITGFKWGLEKNYDVFIEMDADLSHNPKYLPAMFALLDKNDVVIGSRNIKGGGVVGWGLIRKFISRFGSLYSRTVLNTPIYDFTGGYNIWKREVLIGINLDTIISSGYLFQIELKYKARKKGFKIIEYPIIFEDRINGKSKMSKKIVLEAFTNIWKIKFLK